MTRPLRLTSLAAVSLCALLTGAPPVLAQAPAASAPKPAARSSASTTAPAKAELSDVVKAPRPKGGEYFGLYLMDKKVGWLFTDVELLPGEPARVKSSNQLVFKAMVATRVSERVHREERIYEAKPGGRLLSFTVTQKGDGGDQTLEGTATPDGMRVVRKRPGRPDEELAKLPTSMEHVEDADPARVALLRKAKVTGFTLDGLDLETYGLTTTVEPPEQRVINGVKVKLSKVSSLSEKEKVPVTSFITQRGETVLVDFGQTMQARKETEPVAKRLDLVEVFGLTRVVLPKPLPESARAVPGKVTLVVQGLPEKFREETYRQHFKPLPDGKVEVTLSAAAPSEAARKPRPLADPDGGENLKSSIIVESDAPAIREQAKKIVGDEKDAYRAAQKVSTWVATNLEKDYGASADRATDVLSQRRGDCTEHSLLTVALLRAAGIPARRVDGVIYMVNQDGVPALYWHEWVEAYVGEWTQMDPTFNQVVADATHFGFGEEGNAEITPLIGALKVTDVK
ncbi:transglutaminase domain-containing protein [Pyxidicoccus caerfyrddinensis]|uniref:transglutaminase domain-containing protein n=1 Tax=Pyxidicoccus caerfyrddinensis TaxID=2709663 RepID=UPI001967843A|nr:transglutaminase domain-containing protein [Pyxidicoccus caerfyrddinensis]